MNKEQLAESREVDYRLSKWIITNAEQLLSPEEIEEIWRELLSFYSPPTASVENVCGTMAGSRLGKYVVPTRTMNMRKAGLVRRQIERITVFDDRLAFEFKCGLETEVQM